MLLQRATDAALARTTGIKRQNKQFPAYCFVILMPTFMPSMDFRSDVTVAS